MILVIDLFCGAGGVTTGFEQAEVDGEKVAKVIACVNHDPMAIASHTVNHPDVVHFTEDIKHIQMEKLQAIVAQAKAQHPDALILLWASLECTNFSKAKGGLPRNADSRSLADYMPWYVESLKPDYIGIENVIEFMAWGPLDDNGKPISKRSGVDYMRWVEEMKVLNAGYDYEWRELNAADYGAYTSRKRFFGMFATKGLPIAFPEPTHCKKPSGGLFDQLEKWKPVREVLDLEDKGESILIRKKRLSPKTLERIMAGLVKFVAGGQQAFISKYYSGKPEGKNISIDGPAGTVTTVVTQAIVQPQFMLNYHHSSTHADINEPNPTITTKDKYAVVSPEYLIQYNGKPGTSEFSTAAPSRTITTKDRLAFIQPQYIMRDFSKTTNQSIENPAGSLLPFPKMNLVSAEPFILNANSSTAPANDLNNPAPTLTQRRHYIINPSWFNTNAGSIDEPCCTLIARQDKAPLYLVNVSESDLNYAVNVGDFFDEIDWQFISDIANQVYGPKLKKSVRVEIVEFMELYGISDIKMRMLKEAELLPIQDFPRDYFEKVRAAGINITQTQVKRYIGNAVVPRVCKKMAETLHRRLRILNYRVA